MEENPIDARISLPSLQQIKGAKVRTRNRNVIETKQGPWETVVGK